MRRWIVPAVLAVVAVISGWASVGLRPSTVSLARPSATLTTPVLSPRRLPVALSRLAADTRLSRELSTVLDDPDLGPARTASCLAVRLGTTTVFDERAGTALLPASNLKLLVGLVALQRLGVTSHLTTSVRSARPVVNGVIDGPLWLVGGGDPLLTTDGYRPSEREFTWSSEPSTRLERLADEVRGAGVRVITGGVVGDDARYDGQRSLPSWKPSYLTDGEIGAVGALIVNDGFQSMTRRIPAAAPAATAAAAFSVLLSQRGIVVGNGGGPAVPPPGSATVASLASLTVHDLVAVMLRESDNLAAEMLVKELGARFGGGGTWAAGTKVVRDTLTTDGLPMSGFVALDGSGLDRQDQASCALLSAALTSPVAAATGLADDLSVAGRSGTLAQRMAGQASVGRLRAKTGSLSGVSALTGLMTPAPAPAPAATATPLAPAPARASASATPPAGPAPPSPPSGGAGPQPLAFSLLANGLPHDILGIRLEDRLAAILAAYPEAPAPETLGPSTPAPNAPPP
jgi:D-alanyl-D-alanine carboxypeptidase/D-alanyl-D-alanine-endopeptidase (penicillin-binding protein 4)